jgi:hypothetical protein
LAKSWFDDMGGGGEDCAHPEGSKILNKPSFCDIVVGEVFWAMFVEACGMVFGVGGSGDPASRNPAAWYFEMQS